MLVLTRKLDEVLCIGDDIRIKILKINLAKGGKGQVKIGIDAPREVPVFREEIAWKKKK